MYSRKAGQVKNVEVQMRIVVTENANTVTPVKMTANVTNVRDIAHPRSVVVGGWTFVVERVV